MTGRPPLPTRSPLASSPASSVTEFPPLVSSSSSAARPPALSTTRPSPGNTNSPWTSSLNSPARKKKSALSTETVDVPVDPTKNYWSRLPDEVLIYILAQLDPFDLVCLLLSENSLQGKNSILNKV